MILLASIAVSCSRENPAPVVSDDEPEEVLRSDGDREKYGKTIVIGTQEFPISTFRKEGITDGMDYMKLAIEQEETEGGFKLLAHLVRLERRKLSEDIAFQSLLGGKYLTTRSTPLDIAKRESIGNQTVLATINGDFFIMEEGGTFLGNMVSNGSIIKTADNDWTVTYGVTKDNKLFIDELNYTISVDKDNYPVNSINGPRLGDQLVLYTSVKGAKTGANMWGSEILLKPIDGDWETLESYDDVVCEVISNNPMAVDGGIAIPEGHIVLSGHGVGVAVCNRYKKGDMVNIKVSKPKGKEGNSYDVKNAIGASYPILLNGAIQQINSVSGNPNNRETRSAIGHSDDFFYILVVEGRSPVSDGVTIEELSYLLKHFEVTNAVNLDGGGSTMLVIGNSVLGQPAGTTWFRPVPNAISIIRKN